MYTNRRLLLLLKVPPAAEPRPPPTSSGKRNDPSRPMKQIPMCSAAALTYFSREVKWKKQCNFTACSRFGSLGCMWSSFSAWVSGREEGIQVSVRQAAPFLPLLRRTARVCRQTRPALRPWHPFLVMSLLPGIPRWASHRARAARLQGAGLPHLLTLELLVLPFRVNRKDAPHRGPDPRGYRSSRLSDKTGDYVFL